LPKPSRAETTSRRSADWKQNYKRFPIIVIKLRRVGRFSLSLYLSTPARAASVILGFLPGAPVEPVAYAVFSRRPPGMSDHSPGDCSQAGRWTGCQPAAWSAVAPTFAVERLNSRRIMSIMLSPRNEERQAFSSKQSASFSTLIKMRCTLSIFTLNAPVLVLHWKFKLKNGTFRFFAQRNASYLSPANDLL
jgi:hypothetical protein